MNRYISVIIVNWNGKKWLKKCFDTLHKQTYTNFEIILVDNNSTDDSIKFTQLFYPKVRVIKSEVNLGFAGGNNLGIKYAKGEYILLLNNDVWIESDFLQKLFNFYKLGNFDVVSAPEANYYTLQKTPQYVTQIDIFGHYVHKTINGLQKENSFYLTGVCLLFKKELYLQTQGLDDGFFMYSEEVDWFWRLLLLKKKFSYINDKYVYHAGGGSSGVGLKYKSFLWRNQNTLQMLIKNYSCFILILVLPIYFIQNVIEIFFFYIALKPQIANTYLQGWLYNIQNLNNILKKRRWIQKHRMVNDNEIFKHMYFGFGKLKHLRSVNICQFYKK